MKNLQDATERICELKGGLVALDALLPAVVRALPAPTRARLMAGFDAHAEAARTMLLHADISELVLTAFERDFARYRALLLASLAPAGPAAPAGVDGLLLTTTRIATFLADAALSSASGFFYRNGDRLFLLSNRHVFADADSAHHPDRIEIWLHTDAQNLTRCARVSLPLLRDGQPLWRETRDSGGAVDIAALEIPAGSLPAEAAWQAFDASHLDAREEQLAIGDALTIAGFPLGFHDTVHYLAVARSASIASAYGVRFQGQGCFLTDARTHRGSSGSPVVRRRVNDGVAAPSWQLVGVHSTRMDMRTRDLVLDESLGLNCAWYADVLPGLTAPDAPAAPG
jgi:S1-C subfamily serine protease